MSTERLLVLSVATYPVEAEVEAFADGMEELAYVEVPLADQSSILLATRLVARIYARAGLPSGPVQVNTEARVLHEVAAAISRRDAPLRTAGEMSDGGRIVWREAVRDERRICLSVDFHLPTIPALTE